jgi:hypothetical protein
VLREGSKTRERVKNLDDVEEKVLISVAGPKMLALRPALGPAVTTAPGHSLEM